MTDLWPIDILRPKDDRGPNLRPRSVGSPPALSGFTQTIVSDAPIWALSYLHPAARPLTQAK